MKKSVVIWIHVGVWCIYALLAFMRILLLKWYMTPVDMGKVSVLLAYAKPVIFYATYFLMYLVLKNKKNGMYVVLFFLIAFLYPFFAGYYKIALNFYSLIGVIQSSFWGALFYLGFDWYQKKEQKKELERQNLQSELKLLKNQVNPHFLFNTLNNIDRLIVSNPDKASSMLVGLSGMILLNLPVGLSLLFG